MPRTDDPRSTADLIALVVNDIPGEEWSDEAHIALIALHQRATRDVFEAARDLCLSAQANHQAAGVWILGQLGGPERAFPEESCDAILGVLQKTRDPEIIDWAIFALGHLGHHGSDTAVMGFAGHPRDKIRHGVAFALCGSTSVEVIPTLLTLMDDPYEMARDWATTAIGQTLEWDGPDIRDALLNRTDDPDEITRAEALRGLARRKDSRAIPFLIQEITAPERRQYLFIDAAKEYLGIPEDQKIEAEHLLASLRAVSS